MSSHHHTESRDTQEAAAVDVPREDGAADVDKNRDDYQELFDESDLDEVDSEDSLTFSNGVIEKIVAIALREVPGVVGVPGGFIQRVQETFGSSSKGIVVEVMPDNGVRVNVSVIVEYGAYAQQIFEDVKRVVVKEIYDMTGLEVVGVNLRIEDVVTSEEFREQKNAHGGQKEGR